MPTFILDRPHALAFHDIMLVTAGRGSFTLDGRPHRVSRGTVLFTAPDQVRDWSVEGLDGICLFFTTEFLDDFLNDSTFLARLPYFGDAKHASIHLAPAEARQMRASLTRMRRELRSLRGDSVDLLRALLYETLVTLSRHYMRRRRVPAERPTNALVSRFRALVESHAPRHHDVAWYARELDVSSGHLNVLCKQTTRETAKRTIELQLALRARRALLFSEAPAARIAEDLGFADPSYFSRFMRRMEGKAPSALRRRATGSPPRPRARASARSPRTSA